MKNRILMLTIVCLTVVLTFWVFLNFQHRWRTSIAFQAITKNAPISTRHLFVAPSELGIHTWNIGDAAVYELKTNILRRQISFHVSAQASAQFNSEFWLTTKGLLRYNGTDIDIWRLLSLSSLRPGSERAEFLFARGAVPFSIPQRHLPAYSVILKYIGDENIETPIGVFKCKHYFVQLQAPEGHSAPLLELWANPKVLPIGIVRARWRDQVLDLVEIQKQPRPKIPEMLSETIEATQRKSSHKVKIPEPAASVCIQCHKSEIGGTALKQGSLTTLSSTEFVLTQALYHHHAAKLVHPQEPLLLQLTSQRGQPLVSRSVRFTWAKGSFRVKTNLDGHVVLSLDENAYQNNIRVVPEKGYLILNVFKEGL